MYSDFRLTRDNHIVVIRCHTENFQTHNFAAINIEDTYSSVHAWCRCHSYDLAAELKKSLSRPTESDLLHSLLDEISEHNSIVIGFLTLN